jgi:hypothetical protein
MSLACALGLPASSEGLLDPFGSSSRPPPQAPVDGYIWTTRELPVTTMVGGFFLDRPKMLGLERLTEPRLRTDDKRSEGWRGGCEPVSGRRGGSVRAWLRS